MQDRSSSGSPATLATDSAGAAALAVYALQLRQQQQQQGLTAEALAAAEGLTAEALVAAQGLTAESLAAAQGYAAESLAAAQAAHGLTEAASALQAAEAAQVVQAAQAAQTLGAPASSQVAPISFPRGGCLTEPISEGDWQCVACGNINFQRRDQCNRCTAPKTESDYSARGKGRQKDSPICLYVQGLPMNYGGDEVKAVFAKYGNVVSAKMLPLASGKTQGAGFIRMPEADGNWCLENLNGETPPGLPGPISVTLPNCAPQVTEGVPRSFEDLQFQTMQPVDRVEHENLVVKGLPVEITEAYLAQVIGQYGTVVSVKILSANSPDPSRVPTKAAAKVRMASTEEAKSLLVLLDGKIPNGLQRPIALKFVGDGIPAAQKVFDKRNSGDSMFHGQLKSYSVEKQSGLIHCDDLFEKHKMMVYAWHSVLESCHAEPGDTLLFFIFWKGDKPQASAPMMRIAADPSAPLPKYALRGYFMGFPSTAADYGIVECSDLRLLFGSDVYVHKMVAGSIQAGWVSFNARVDKVEDGGLKAQVVSMAPCSDDWKASPGNLNISRKVGPTPLPINDTTGFGASGSSKSCGKTWWESLDPEERQYMRDCAMLGMAMTMGLWMSPSGASKGKGKAFGKGCFGKAGGWGKGWGGKEGWGGWGPCGGCKGPYGGCTGYDGYDGCGYGYCDSYGSWGKKGYGGYGGGCGGWGGYGGCDYGGYCGGCSPCGGRGNGGGFDAFGGGCGSSGGGNFGGCCSFAGCGDGFGACDGGFRGCDGGCGGFGGGCDAFGACSSHVGCESEFTGCSGPVAALFSACGAAEINALLQSMGACVAAAPEGGGAANDVSGGETAVPMLKNEETEAADK